MKHLVPEQLARLDAYWQDWAYQPSQEKQLRVRLRLYFIYLLIRYGGLRLGEALALDDNRDLVFSTATVLIRGSRDIQIQEQAMTALLKIVEHPALAELHGHLAGIDPGYVRKSFYQAACACGLPDKTLGGPRVLRHARGAELMESGVPAAIVQKFLGLQSPVQAIRLREFQDGEAKQIIHAHLRRETLRRSSARNAFAGAITRIQESRNMAQVTLTALSGLEVTAIISMESMRSLDLRKGQTVTAQVKAPWVVLAPAGAATSCANNFQGTVLFIRKGSLEASVRLRLADGTGMAAMLSLDAVERLGLAEGAVCTVSFSAMSVVLAPG
ncbi:MAG: TOBE domain-containing protein [Desulfovibrio sp.]|jgi:molybdate transport system regulatory protein|nr:TOBE domain-containing protein [Desulfovibrio sp.]MBQ4125430.1 TOBE domain-containing protein [Desulfovibrio sp.]MCR5170088.1 TOBE domain-containing protein [Desulfovibrio sp.]